MINNLFSRLVTFNPTCTFKPQFFNGIPDRSMRARGLGTGTAAWISRVLLGGFALAGMSLQAHATVSATPASLSWASVPVGNTGGQKVATLSNTNTTAITISSIAIGGTNAGDFRIFSKTCGTSLAASTSCTVNVVFAPTAAGNRPPLISPIRRVPRR